MNKVIIEIRGGIIDCVTTSEKMDVTIIDYDTEGQALEEQFLNNEGEECYIEKRIGVPDLERIKDIEEAIAESDWVCTDEDTNQYRKKITDTIFIFKEDRVIDPLTGKKEVFQETINLEKFSWEEIIDSCAPFGYKTKQVDDWLNTGRESDLIAECIFEML